MCISPAAIYWAIGDEIEISFSALRQREGEQPVSERKSIKADFPFHCQCHATADADALALTRALVSALPSPASPFLISRPRFVRSAKQEIRGTISAMTDRVRPFGVLRSGMRNLA